MQASSESMQLQPGMLSVCDVQWDDEISEYERASYSETMECCMNQCIDPMEACVKGCREAPGAIGPSERRRCLRMCDVMRDLCAADCFLVPADEMNVQDLVFEKCASEHCLEQSGLGQWFDSKCIDKHQDAIRSCCRDRCIPTASVNCDEACDWQIAHVGSPQVPLVSASSILKEARSEKVRVRTEDWDDSNSVKYLLVAVGAAALFMIIFLSASNLLR